MTLENLLRTGQLKAHAADEREILRLPKTIGLAGERVRVLEAFRKARNQNDYRGIPISDVTARECAEEAGRLLADVRAWLEARRASG